MKHGTFKKLLAVIRDKTIRLRILEDFRIVRICGEIVGEKGGVPFCHPEVVQEIITAVFRRGAGNNLRVLNGTKGSEQQIMDLPRRTVALKNEIKARQTPHGSPVDNLVFPVWIVTKEGGYEVLKRVHRRNINRWLSVRSRQSYVVSRYHAIADLIHPAGKDAGNYEAVVNGKTRNQMISSPFSESQGCLYLRDSGAAVTPCDFHIVSAETIIGCTDSRVKRQYSIGTICLSGRASHLIGASTN